MTLQEYLWKVVKDSRLIQGDALNCDPFKEIVRDTKAERWLKEEEEYFSSLMFLTEEQWRAKYEDMMLYLEALKPQAEELPDFREEIKRLDFPPELMGLKEVSLRPPQIEVKRNPFVRPDFAQWVQDHIIQVTETIVALKDEQREADRKYEARVAYKQKLIDFLGPIPEEMNKEKND